MAKKMACEWCLQEKNKKNMYKITLPDGCYYWICGKCEWKAQTFLGRIKTAEPPLAERITVLDKLTDGLRGANLTHAEADALVNKTFYLRTVIRAADRLP